MPREPSRWAAVSPVGPAPTTRTGGVSDVVGTGLLDRLVGRSALGQQPFGLGEDLLGGQVEVDRLPEGLAYVAVDAEVDLVAVALGIEEVDPYRVAVGD